jgi:transposase-like protein
MRRATPATVKAAKPSKANSVNCLEIPRDRHGSFEPQIIPKHQTRWDGFHEKILSLYARGMTVREIQSHLEEMYGAEVSPTLVSSVTEAVMEDAKAWQNRPLDALYPIVYLDCIHVKVRDGGVVRAKAVYLALGINMAGQKEILGLWIAQTEGAKFWLQVVTYTTNAIESVNMGMRKITKNRGSFPSDDALLKLFYLALNNIIKKWTMPIRDWKAALTRFTIQFEERIPKP